MRLHSFRDRLVQLREVAGGIEAELGRIRHHLLLHKKALALTWVGVRHTRGANIHLPNGQNISLEKMMLDEDFGKFVSTTIKESL